MSSLLRESRFPKHSERIVFTVNHVVANVPTSYCFGKLMCCHYTTAAKNNNCQRIAGVFGISDHCNLYHRIVGFECHFAPKW